MKSEAELNKAILTVLTKIDNEAPELSKYIKETPVNLSEDNGITRNSLAEYYDSLCELLAGYKKEHELIDNQNLTNMKQSKHADKNREGYPSTPIAEDVYNKWKEEADLNPEDLTKRKSPNERPGMRNEKDFLQDMSGADLDVPGTELDDAQERIGSEDEENNYYSIGGDAHNDLDEDNS